MKLAGAITLFLTVSYNTGAVPVIYTTEAHFLSELSLLGYPTIFENFENKSVWAASRSPGYAPLGTPSVTSQGITWTSNFTQNKIATSNGVGGNSFYLYSTPHGNVIDSSAAGCDTAQDPNIPLPCHQNDGLLIQSETVGLLYAIGGYIDSSSGTGAISSVTFLLDGVDIYANGVDNIDNKQRLGETVDNWSFFGVIDEEGFYTAELRELEGKDIERVSIFTDNFTIAASSLAVPVPAAIWLFGSGLFCLIGLVKRKKA